MVSEAMLSESILSLASAIAEKDVTSQGNGTKAKALEVLGNVLEAKGIQQLEGDDAIYALSQYAQRKSSDTVAAALGVGGCASGMVKPTGTITITENGEGIDVAQYATADVSVSGGGGGDFTTATVTIVNNTAASFEGTMPMAFDGEVSGASSDFYVDVNETVVLTAILYKGHSAAIIHPEGTVAIEGSATDLGDGFIDVTGDCTITAS